MDVEALISKFENKEPEIVFEWKDAETEARGWVVINSLRGGAAGGGTRMRKGLDRAEVMALAKTMEVKFSVCGPAIGGAKAGINFDPADPRKKAVLERWYKAVMPLLKCCWGTGGDLNVDEVHEVIPVTQALGLPHPQAGIVVGHFKVDEAEKLVRIDQLRKGVSKLLDSATYSPDLSKKFVVADMATGYGVAEAARQFLELGKESVKGMRVVIQGWGNVSTGAAFFLAQHGAKIVGIIDRAGGLINEQGYDLDQIRQLILSRDGNALGKVPGLLTFDQVNAKIWDVKQDIFIPAAASRLVTQDQAERLVKSGCKVISCGANVPFADKEIFFGPIARYLDEKVAVVPDFIANSGMARVFAYLMTADAQLSDKAIFDDIAANTAAALKAVRARNAGKTGITRTGFEIAMGKLI